MTGATEVACFPPGRAKSAAPPVLHAGAPRLFCLPHSGAGASFFRDWVGALAPDVEAIPVQLPGRENRYREPAFTAVSDLVADLTEPMARRAGTDYALFGHSMGALLCYELAHVLSALGMPPRHLFVSGLGAPHLPPSGPVLHELPDDELVAVIADLEGTSTEVLDQPELMQFLLPLLRADLTVWETYEAHRGPLAVPTTVMRGRHDRSVALDRAEAWRSLTSADFRLAVFDGGHFFHQTDPADVIALIRERLHESRIAPT